MWIGGRCRAQGEKTAYQDFVGKAPDKKLFRRP